MTTEQAPGSQIAGSGAAHGYPAGRDVQMRRLLARDRAIAEALAKDRSLRALRARHATGNLRARRPQ